MRYGVDAPIVVEGLVWGAMNVSSRRGPLPVGLVNLYRHLGALLNWLSSRSWVSQYGALALAESEPRGELLRRVNPPLDAAHHPRLKPPQLADVPVVQFLQRSLALSAAATKIHTSTRCLRHGG